LPIVAADSTSPRKRPSTTSAGCSPSSACALEPRPPRWPRRCSPPP